MSSCIFCDRSAFEILAENDLAFAIRDKHPVRPMHTLVLPKRHEADGLHLTITEITAVFELANEARQQIVEADPSVKGFNFGLNSGAIAGQKIPHAHFHLIPRRLEEEAPPPAKA